MAEASERPVDQELRIRYAFVDSFTRSVDTETLSPEVSAFLDSHYLSLDRYDFSSENMFPYHNIEHGLDVARRAVWYVRKSARIEGHDPDPNVVRRADLGGQGHDVKILAKLVTDPLGLLCLQQIAGWSEFLSADEIEYYIRRKNDTELSSRQLSDQDISEIRMAPIATIPRFDAEMGVYQPYVNAKLPLAPRMVALADLSVMREGPQAFLRDSNELFRESKVGVLMLLDRHKDGQRLTPFEQDLIQESCLTFSKSQMGFIHKRMHMLPRDLDGLPRKTRDHFRAMLEIDHDEALKFMSARYTKRKSMDFQKLVGDFGYPPELIPAA